MSQRPICFMKDIKSLPFVDVTSLRVGLYVYLELGWMSHPFPLSHFKIASDDQVTTIRGLGLKKVRWCEAQSDADAAAVLTGKLPPHDGSLADQETTLIAAVHAPVEAPDVTVERHLRDALAVQRANLVVCEKQFAEVTRECKGLNDLTAIAPKEAGERALALSRAMLDKMVGEQELAIRVLSDAAGDKASAHAVNVMLLSLLLGRSLGWSESDLMDLGVGALTHDVGKLQLPERVRSRQEHFSPAEQCHYEGHVARGVQTGHAMGLSAAALKVIAQHHEMMDGSGFPTHALGERLSEASKVVAIVNRYDNLCNPHMPSHALTPHEALSLMFAQGRAKFDNTLLTAFIKMMGVYPPGSLVQLSDERFATVVAVNASRPLKPMVLAYERNVPREEALIVDLQDLGDVSIRRSLKPVGLPPEALVYLSPRQRVAYFFEPVMETEAA